MIHEVIVKPLAEEMSDISMPTTYNGEKGEVRILLENDEFENFNINKGNIPRSKQITFRNTLRSIIYKYEDDEDLQTPEDKKVKRLIEVFYKAHPCFVVNGIPHKGTKAPLFNIIDMSELNGAKLKLWNQKLKVANILNGMTLAEKREVSFYYGSNPEGKTDGDLLLMLGDFEIGECMFESTEISKFIELWGKGEENKERDFIVNANKAIAMGIIEDRPSEDNRINYYLGNTFIGVEFNDVIAYFKREERVYAENIVRVINSKDTFKKEEKGSRKESESRSGEMTDLEIEELRVEAKLLKVKGFIDVTAMTHVMKGQKLLDAVIIGRKNKATFEANEIANVKA